MLRTKVVLRRRDEEDGRSDIDTGHCSSEGDETGERADRGYSLTTGSSLDKEVEGLKGSSLVVGALGWDLDEKTRVRNNEVRAVKQKGKTRGTKHRVETKRETNFLIIVLLNILI